MNEPSARTSFSRKLKVSGNLDRRQAEALALQLRQLARQHNLEIDLLRIETARPTKSSRSKRLPRRTPE